MSARLAAALLAVIVLATLVGPLFSPYEVDTIDFAADWNAPPSLSDGHWFGTDSLGRDVFARTMGGGRISLLVGLVATLVSVAIGVAYGAVSGYVGGAVDAWMMRAVDVLYALPFMFLVILLMVAFGREFVLVFVALGLVNWLDMARIVRGQAMALRARTFVLAAQLCGVPDRDIIRHHIVPNLTGTVVACATLTVPQVVLIESFLSFLGLGVQEPMTSWGVLVNDGVRDLELAPWTLAFPAAFLVTTLLCLNVVGDQLLNRMRSR